MNNYNYVQKFLHNFIFSNKFILRSLYDLEKILFSKNIDNIKYNHHIFITSLPRSGTTILLNCIFDSQNFSSLTYKQMPFVLSPNMFSKINFFSSNKKKERAHTDGIFYNINSPEAFDEVFFNLFSEEEISIEIYNFINLVLNLNNKKRYLSKNNSNYKRIKLIQKLLPNSLFIIPIRNPLQQAYSLFKQHKNFLKLQEKDIFVLKYMNYLGHHEFGKNHKYWFKPNKFHNLNDHNYWLEQWLFFYRDALNKHKKNENCIFIKYENLSNHNYLKEISEKLQIENLANNFFKNKDKKIDLNFDQELFEKSTDLYNSL
ncbi:sulfotransferase [Candidatus Pelagibacter sp.]|jgi:hypothetical protein|nr:sulfotransferase [Candidatus Pelagibacter sp.]